MMRGWTKAQNLPVLGLCLCLGLLGACTSGDSSSTGPPSASPAATTAPAASEQSGSFRLTASECPWRDSGCGWYSVGATMEALLMPVTARGEYQAEDDQCTQPVALAPDLPDPQVRGLVRPEVTEQAEEGEQRVWRTSPHGVRVVYRAGPGVLGDAFVSIAEQIGRCVIELPFQEQDRNGLIRVQSIEIGPLGDEQVAVRVSDVGPNSDSAGWTADYYWIGFVRDGGTLVGVTLNEAWRGSSLQGGPDEYPQPTMSDAELTTQLVAALAAAE